MSIELPEPIAIYFDAENANDLEILAHCFATDAIVRDEGRTIEGLPAIQEWKAQTTAKYQHTAEPRSCTEQDGKTIVATRLKGNFPGSPIDVKFIFALDGAKITSLEIHS
jgi:ketosteroid isomerase-like protein